MKKIGIYKITNPNGRVYIGQSIDIENRFKKYKYNCRTQIKLKNSFEKYSVINHSFEIIEECLETELNQKERYWQDYYNVIGPNGLNCRLTATNDKSGAMSEETKLKVSLSKIGKNLGVEPWNKGKKCDNISKALKGKFVGNKNPMFGKTASKLNKEKSSEANKGKKHSKEINLSKGRGTRLVLCLVTGIFYRSYVEAAQAYNLKSNYLSEVLSGRRKNKTSLIYV